jgi:hypothetical protein
VPESFSSQNFEVDVLWNVVGNLRLGIGPFLKDVGTPGVPNFSIRVSNFVLWEQIDFGASKQFFIFF